MVFESFREAPKRKLKSPVISPLLKFLCQCLLSFLAKCMQIYIVRIIFYRSFWFLLFYLNYSNTIHCSHKVYFSLCIGLHYFIKFAITRTFALFLMFPSYIMLCLLINLSNIFWVPLCACLWYMPRIHQKARQMQHKSVRTKG